ncbi:MAG: ribonuclease J, partial [Patescibacteria group bacterium]
MISKYKSTTSPNSQSLPSKDSRPPLRRPAYNPSASRPNPRPTTGFVKSSRPQFPSANRATLRGPRTPFRQVISVPGAMGSLRVMALGGLEEVGRNMMLIEYNKEIIIVDMGLQFPEEDMLGIDYIIPNISYLEDKKDWIKGVVITHGHYDHIGGIPHIMGRIGNPPMFMGKLTAGLVRKRNVEFQSSPNLNIKEIDETTKIKLGQNFNLEFLRVNHSIPDCFAVIVDTPLGRVVHTGDFKIDFTPVNDKPADLNRIAQIGAGGVLLLLSDSTDATHAGYQISESAIGDEMDKLFEKINGRVIIGTFASQLSRVQKIFDHAAKHSRRVLLQGRSMNDNVEVAHQVGYLKFNPRLLVDERDVNKIPDSQLVIIGTGAQGE